MAFAFTNTIFSRCSTTCTPQLSLPPELFSLDPAWVTCAPNVFGSFDPPVALKPAKGLTVPESASVKPTAPSVPVVVNPVPEVTPPPGIPQPTPRPTPPPPLPSPAPVPVNNPPANSPLPVNNPPANNPPANNPPANNPPANNPPANSPPATNPPANNPPANISPAYDPPANNPPTDNSPANNPSLVVTSAASPPPNPSPNVPAPIFVPPPITIAGSTILLDTLSNYVLGTQTLAPGGTLIVVAGTTISLAPLATALIIGSITAPLTPSPAAATPRPITIGTQTITTNAQSQFLIAGQTLAPGGPPITVSSTTISLAPSATALIVNGRTSPLLPLPAAATTVVPPSRAPALIIVGTRVITANAQSQYLVSSQTLVPGGQPVTIDSTLVSLGRSATNVVVGSSIIGLGGVIISGLGGTATQVASGGRGGSTASAYTGPLYTGAAGRLGCPGVIAAVVKVMLLITMCM